LKRNSTIQELDESSDEDDEESEESNDENEEIKETEKEESGDEFSVWKEQGTPKKQKPKKLTDEEWEEQQVLFLQRHLQRRTPSVESVESVKKKDDDEDSLQMDLSNLYQDGGKLPMKSSQDDIDVIDDFMKETEVDEESTEKFD
jgi:hypothetical protein